MQISGVSRPVQPPASAEGKPRTEAQREAAERIERERARQEKKDYLTFSDARRARATMSPRELQEQIRSANEQAEAQAKEYENLGKCLIIASRIIAGDKVPREDEQFLMEQNSELYMRAITMRIRKEDPEEYDRLSEEEESELEESGGSAPPEAAAPADTGGEVPAPEAPAAEVVT